MISRRQFGRHALMAGAAALAAPQSEAWQSVAPAAYTGGASLLAYAAPRGLFVGAAVNQNLLDHDAEYSRTIVDQYNIVVAENAMKWGPLRPGPTRFDFAAADRFVSFAEAHNMKVRGHNLCWHEQLPAWFAATVNKGNAEQFLKQHIATVAGRYRGRIRAWDVVNEAIDPRDMQPDGLRNSPWFQLLGPRYIDTAFRAAREADPSALLTYNDYGIESDTAGDTQKRAAVLALLKRLKAANVPIDAVGIQSHISAGSASQIGAGLMAFVDQCAAMGLQVFVTELDVNDDAITTDDPQERAKQVAAIYRNYLTLLLQHAAVTDVLTWGVSNRYSWLNGHGPAGEKFRPKHPDREELCLPFDDSYKPLPAFFAMRDSLDTRRA